MNQNSQNEWIQVQALFEALFDLPPDGRAAELTRATEPPPVIAKVRELLAAADSTGILDGQSPQFGLGEGREPAGFLAAGQGIGPFTVERLLGRGGMGEVYLARRTSEDFNQRVALKLLRIEATAQAHLFARERRMLARLDHPGIARLIDGGIAPDGRPYMAMEYVDGEAVDVWCRENHSDLRARLTIFQAICDAVSFAHANLVVHRDIKPSNVLVDRNGHVRLLDFGIAKLLDDAAAMPATTQALMTPDYAAPEQLEGEDATVATDVYALGVMLFELVVGFGPWRRDSNSVPAIIRRVLYEDPVLPSAAAKRDDAPIPSGRISGDIDAIILKAMRRDPAQRYRSVSDLAEDVGRHLEVKPVKARDGSTRYMAGRFIRRYRWAVGASAAALLALLIGAGGIAWQARQTAIERDLAKAEARRSESINRMLTVMFRDTAASDDGENATVRQMLDKAATQLVASVDTSVKSATLVTTLSDLYVNMEDIQAADGLLSRALEKGIGKDDPVSTAQIKLRLASTAAGLGRTEDMAGLLDASEPVFRSDPARFRAELLEATSSRAQLARRTGDVTKAIALMTAVLPEADVVYAENHRDLLTLYNNLLVYMIEANQLDAMPAVFARADVVLKRTGQEENVPGLAITQLKGMRLLKLDQPERAEAVFINVAARRRATFGRSGGLAVDLVQLARARLAMGKFAEAKAALLEARPMAIKNLGPAALPSLVSGLSLIEAMAETGDLAEASRIVTEITPIIETMPKTAPPAGMLTRARAILLFKQGKKSQALAELDRAQAIFEALGPAGETYLKVMPKLRARMKTGD